MVQVSNKADIFPSKYKWSADKKPYIQLWYLGFKETKRFLSVLS